MSIITAPHLLDAGRQVDWGFFCHGCGEEKEEETSHYRIKYTREDIVEHVARLGAVVKNPKFIRRFMHATEI